jgi:deoxyribodipyrimidine photo-lyase
MGQEWRLGAALFDSLLVDHDWAVNLINWAYFAGVGNDPRNRVFRTVSQGEMYDPEAALIKAWLPELKGLPAACAHQPWALPAEVARQCGFDLARDYVEPLLEPASQIAVNYGKQRPG